jgi:hypothetical protein
MSQPTINLDLGIAAISIEGDDDESFDELFDEFQDYFEADTFEGVVRNLKSMDYELDEAYPDVDMNGGQPSGGTFQ